MIEQEQKAFTAMREALKDIAEESFDKGAVECANHALTAANAVIEQHARDAVTWTPETGYVFAQQPQAQGEAERFNCPECRHSFNVADELERPRLECPVCGHEPINENLNHPGPAHPQATEPAGWKLVPLIPTEEQWGGLARDIMMWIDMNGRKTPESLLKHLAAMGITPPEWLLNEPEMKHLDHSLSKGTRAAIIYRAMLAAAPEAP